MVPHRLSENSTRVSEQEISLLGFASSDHNIATGDFGEDLYFHLFRFGINIDNILV